jgi:hypothetical protein
MYSIILALHNIVRWIVVILVVVAVVRAYLGRFGKREWTEIERKVGAFVGMAIDIQLLLGLLLYFFLSPLTKSAMLNFGAAIQAPDLRLFTLVHPVLMVFAVVFAHLGSILPRKVTRPASKFERAALWFSLTLLMILLGMPWARPLLPGLG